MTDCPEGREKEQNNGYYSSGEIYSRSDYLYHNLIQNPFSNEKKNIFSFVMYKRKDLTFGKPINIYLG
jgi:hypothetical protein